MWGLMDAKKPLPPYPTPANGIGARTKCPKCLPTGFAADFEVFLCDINTQPNFVNCVELALRALGCKNTLEDIKGLCMFLKGHENRLAPLEGSSGDFEAFLCLDGDKRHTFSNEDCFGWHTDRALHQGLVFLRVYLGLKFCSCQRTLGQCEEAGVAMEAWIGCSNGKGGCNGWVHIECENVEGQDVDSINYKCPMCIALEGQEQAVLGGTGVGEGQGVEDQVDQMEVV
jgi:hypothetical protein